jgi:hypothetical protein
MLLLLLEALQPMVKAAVSVVLVVLDTSRAEVQSVCTAAGGAYTLPLLSHAVMGLAVVVVATAAVAAAASGALGSEMPRLALGDADAQGACGACQRPLSGTEATHKLARCC